MSLNNLLTTNNLGPFYMTTLTAINLNYTSLAGISITALTLTVGTIQSAAAGGTLNIGTVNSGVINFGNAANNTSCNFGNSVAMTLVNGPGLTPYTLNGSAVEVNTTVALSGAVSTGSAKVVYRRIGNWVNLFVFYSSNVSVGVTNTSGITMAGALASGYRPAASFVFGIMAIDTGVTPQDVAGECNINLAGDIIVRRLGPTNWTAGANWGFNAFAISFPIT